MRRGTWLSGGSVLAIAGLSVMGFFHLITPETLGIFEALLLCGAWLGALANRPSTQSAGRFLVPAAVIAGIALVWRLNPLLFIYVPALGLNLLLACFCFSTLRPGSVPAITRIARIEQKNFDAVIAAYTRRLTWAWGIVFTGLLLETIAFIAYAPVHMTLLFLNFINYILIAAFFLGENVYRRIRLRRYTHLSPLVLIARLSRRGAMGLVKYDKQG